MEDIKTHCLIVNHENYEDFTNLINDLRTQTVKFRLTIVDQNSKREDLHALYDSLNADTSIDVLYNESNQPLNHVWNAFAESSNCDYLAFLNNDIAVTIHSTNHPDYSKSTDLNYVILDEAWQGWDFTIRKKNYPSIPKSLEWFGGDCWIFSNLVYKQHKKIGCILSSPIIHHQGQTKRSDRVQLSKKDTKEKIRMGFKNPTRKNMDYVNIKPTSTFIKDWIKNNKEQ